MQPSQNLATSDTQHTIHALRALIETCKNGERGFEHAAKDMADGRYEAYRTALAQASRQRAQFADELHRWVQTLGGQAGDEGTFLGVLHRGWLDAKATLEDGYPLSILVECERGELAAQKAFAEVLRASLPRDVRTTIEAQFAVIRRSVDWLRGEIAALRRAAAAPAATTTTPAPFPQIETHAMELEGPPDFWPPMDLRETASAFVLSADLPGIHAEQLDVTVAGRRVWIRGQRFDHGGDDAVYHADECSFGRFARTFTLPVELDATRVKAELEDGVLALTLPKRV
jgi:uncharacterized protein (TIGR02284 family)